jgi:hypothetical protein
MLNPSTTMLRCRLIGVDIGWCTCYEEIEERSSEKMVHGERLGPIGLVSAFVLPTSASPCCADANAGISGR